LKLIQATLPIQGLERANQAFSQEGPCRVIEGEDLGDQKSPAQISDSGSFSGCRVCGGTVCAITILEEQGQERVTFH
jgi:hypothetical protein